MYKYEGLLIHQSHDDQGIIEIVDTAGVRALHFGTSSQQSSMLLSDPDRLHALYARAMMAGLLFHDAPRDVLMIGLGGGSIAKFLLQEFEDCKIKAIEFRRNVLKVARSHFGLPFDARLKIKIGCGAQHAYQESREHQELYDLIVIDAYDAAGMAPEVSSEAFFDNCSNLLSRKGLLIINLWATDKPLLQQVTRHMERAFGERLLFLPVRTRGNIIGFAFGDQKPKPELKALFAKARALEQLYQLEFPTFMLDFKRHNATTLKRVINT